MMKHLAITLLMLGLAATAVGDELQELREEVAALRAENARLKAQIAELTGQKQELVEQNQELATQTEELTQQTEQLSELAGMTPRGERVESQAALFETVYRPESDSTLVRSKSERLEMTKGSPQPHYLTLVYTHPGQEPDGQARSVRWYIQTQFTDGDYRRLDAMAVTLDGDEAIELPVSSYDAKMRGGSGTRASSRRGSEVLMFELDPEALRRVAAATTASGKLGVVEFRLSPDQIATFKAMMKRQSVQPQKDADSHGSE